MKIHNPNNLPVIDYREVKTLQGNLKDLKTKNYNKLLKILKTTGFEIPLFVWKKGEEHYLLDGHQRHRVMTKEGLNDNGNYEVPYILVEAKDEKEAKQKLLRITSQFGTITQDGLDEFIVDLPEAEVYEAVNFDALFTWDPRLNPDAFLANQSQKDYDKAENKLMNQYSENNQQLKPVICPHCGEEFYLDAR